MNMDEELTEDEQIPRPPSLSNAVTSRTTNIKKQQPMNSSFDMTETSDHSSTTTGSMVLRNTGASGKVLILLTAMLAILCSVYTMVSCKFLLVQAVPSSSSDQDSFSLAMGAFAKTNTNTNTNTTTTLATTKAAIGIFSHATEDYANPLSFAKACRPYQDQFWESDFGPLFWSSQLSAILAPCLGGLALGIQVVEMVRRQFLRNFLVLVFLYLMASLIQGYTFAIYGAMDFCWGEDAVQCTLSESGYASVAAAACYYLCVIFMCFVPRQSHHHHHHNKNKPVVSQDHMVPPVPDLHTTTATTASSSISIMEEGHRSVRFEDPPVSRTRIVE